MQGAGHATKASHAIGASELDDGLGMVTLEEERVGASHAMGASELVVFLPDLVAGSTVMVIRIFASQSEEVIFGQGGVQAGQGAAKQGAHHDEGDQGGQVHARHGSHQDVGAFIGAVGVRDHARDACGQGVGDCGLGVGGCGHEAVGCQGLEGGEHDGKVKGCTTFLPSPDVAHAAHWEQLWLAAVGSCG